MREEYRHNTHTEVSPDYVKIYQLRSNEELIYIFIPLLAVVAAEDDTQKQQTQMTQAERCVHSV